MIFKFDEEQEIWRKTLEDFVEKECPREKVREWDENRQYPYEFYDKVAKQGWFGLMIPEEYGGVGGDAILYTILHECLSKYSFDIGAGYSIITWGTKNIALHGSEEQKRHYLPTAIKGEIRFSFSLTEPNAGSDAASITTFAAADGDEFVINGQKVFATGAHLKNNIILLAARTDRNVPKHKGISLLLVPNHLPGIELRPLNTLSRRIITTNELFLEDVRIPRENLLGELNRGWEYLTYQLEMERAAVSASYLGVAQTAVEDALRYAKEREQFGQSIGQFQVIKHMLAEMQMNVDASRLLTYRVAWMLKEGLPAAKEAAMAKLFSSEAYFRVTTQGMQILGGYAQMPEYDMERYFRDAKQAMVGGGTSQIQHEIIARGLGL